MFLSKILICSLLSVFVHRTGAKPLNVEPVNKLAEQNIGADIFEGDIKLTSEQKEALFSQDTELSKRKAINSASRRWNGGEIPFQIKSESEGQRSVIQAALDHWSDNTCVTFVERNFGDRIKFTKQDGCWSYVGRQGGAQEISIGSGCGYLGTVAHEVGHAAGFFHEQSRPDRHLYVNVLSENIQSGAENNFNQYGTGSISTMNVPYDLTSLMHYGRDYFTKNGRPTITTVEPHKQNMIGVRDALSFQDFHLANLMYDCDISCTGSSCENGGYRSSRNGCNCICPPGYTGNQCETEQPIDSCSYQITEAESSSGTISSPNYPNDDYEVNTNCVVHFKGTSQLTITFTAFELEGHSNNGGCYDYIRIQNEDLYYSDDTFCGTDAPPVIIDDDGELVVLFEADGSINAAGYSFTYVFATSTPSTTAASTTAASTTAASTTVASTTEAPTTECPDTAVAPRNYDLIEEAGLGYTYGYMTTWADVKGDGSANAYCRIKKKKKKYPSCLMPDGTEFTIPNAGRKKFDVGLKRTGFVRDMDDDGKDDFCRCIKIGQDYKFSCIKAGSDGFRTNEDEIDLADTPYDVSNCKTFKVDAATGFIY